MRKLESILAERAHLDADDRDLRSRTDAKMERVSLEQSLARLAKELVQASAKQLQKLLLPERLQDAVADAQLIKSPIAKNRQLRIVRRELRDCDWAQIRSQLNAVVQHGAPLGAAISSEATAWGARLTSQGPEALEAFLNAHPAADRSHFRQLIRNVEKASKERRSKAEEKLSEAIRLLIRRY